MTALWQSGLEVERPDWALSGQSRLKISAKCSHTQNKAGRQQSRAMPPLWFDKKNLDFGLEVAFTKLRFVLL